MADRPSNAHLPSYNIHTCYKCMHNILFFSCSTVVCDSAQHPVQANPAQMVLLCDQKLLCVFMGYSHYNGCASCTDETGRVKRNHCKAAIRGCTEIRPSYMDNEVMAYQKETFNICSDKPFVSLLC